MCEVQTQLEIRSWLSILWVHEMHMCSLHYTCVCVLLTGGELEGHDALVCSAWLWAPHGQHPGSDPSWTKSSGQVKVHCFSLCVPLRGQWPVYFLVPSYGYTPSFVLIIYIWPHCMADRSSLGCALASLTWGDYYASLRKFKWLCNGC